MAAPAALFCVLCGSIGRTDERLAETIKRTKSQHVQASLARCSASSGRPTPTASGSSARRRLLTSNDEKTQTVTGYKRRAPTAAADAPNNASNLQAAVQHNADKEKKKQVEATCGPG